MKTSLLCILCLLSSIVRAQVIVADTVTQYDTISITAPFAAKTLSLLDSNFNADQTIITDSIFENNIHSYFSTGVMRYDNGIWYFFSSGTNWVGAAFIKDSLGTDPNSTTGTYTYITANGNVNAGHILAIDVVKDEDNNTWYGFGFAEDQTFYRLNFGSSLSNTPVVTYTHAKFISQPMQLSIMKTGSNWVGLLTEDDASGHAGLWRLDFGTSLAAFPTLTKLPDLGTSHRARLFAMHYENGSHYALTMSYGGDLQLYNFGSDLLSTPTITDKGVYPAISSLSGFVLTSDCGQVIAKGYGITKTVTLAISGSITNTPFITSALNNDAVVSTPCVYTYNNTQHVLYCNNTSGSAGILRRPILNYPSTTSTAYNTDELKHVFSTTGLQTISLLCNDDQGSRAVFCKDVYVRPATTNVTELKKQGGTLQLYPVPANNTLNVSINWKEAQPYTLTIADMQGRVNMQYNSKNTNETIDVSMLPEGVYNIILKGDKGAVQHGRFSVVR